MTRVSTSISNTVKQGSAKSPRPLGSQSCNGPQTSAPPGPKRPNQDAEHASRMQLDFRQSGEIDLDDLAEDGDLSE